MGTISTDSIATHINAPKVVASGLALSLRWRHNEHDCVSIHQRFECLLNRLFRPRSKKTSKIPVTGLCLGNSPETGEFPTQRASNAENVSIWWRNHDKYGNWLPFFSTNTKKNYTSQIIRQGHCYEKGYSVRQWITTKHCTKSFIVSET